LRVRRVSEVFRVMARRALMVDGEVLIREPAVDYGDMSEDKEQGMTRLIQMSLENFR
jgi:hypothetical protein